MQSETVVVGSCPTCNGPAQFIGNGKDITEYRHVDLRRVVALDEQVNRLSLEISRLNDELREALRARKA